MSCSNYNISIFIVATERMGQIKLQTDSKVLPILPYIPNVLMDIIT